MEKEIRPVSPTADAMSAAVQNKQVLDNITRIAVDKALQDIGVEKFTCYHCGKLLSRDKFYKSSDFDCIPGVTRICIDCAHTIAETDGELTVDGLYNALQYLDYPWIEAIYQEALAWKENSNQDLLDCYINRLMVWKGYSGMTFKDSEPFHIEDRLAILRQTENVENEEAYYNRRDVIRLVGYDPFSDYPVDDDKPQLYAQLINFIDEETKNDGMKMSAVIQIVKKINQAEKLNTQIDLYVNDTKNAAKNMVLIDRMSAASQKLMSIATSLAKDNGIAINFNNSKSAGASTLSGKIKKLNEIGLRSAKINSFDLGSCEGMRQVAEISEAARHKRIGYDENIAAEIKDIKVELVEQMTKERDEAKEIARKLLLENRDLKDFLREKGLVDEQYRVIDSVG